MAVDLDQIDFGDVFARERESFDSMLDRALGDAEVLVLPPEVGGDVSSPEPPAPAGALDLDAFPFESLLPPPDGEEPERRFSNLSEASDTSTCSMSSTTSTGARKSKYRGVSQTSRSGWGAKFSSVRIISTCRSEEEAARAYDAYLLNNHRDKFLAYSNFCTRCGQFRNPLKLADVETLCACAEPPELPSDVVMSPAGSAADPADAGASSTEASEPEPDLSAVRLQLTIASGFLERYWRNDRRNIQCFPVCKEYGSYEEGFVAGLKHQVRGVCRSPVVVRASGAAVDPAVELWAWFEAEEAPRAPHLCELGAQIGPEDYAGLCGGSSVKATPCEGGFQFLPDVWKFDGNLPKKKRRGDGEELPNLRFRVCAFAPAGARGARACVAAATSPSFTMGSTRTLVRHKDEYSVKSKRARTAALEPGPAGASAASVARAPEEDVDMLRAWASVPLEASLAAVMSEVGAAEPTPGGFDFAGAVAPAPAEGEGEGEDEDEDEDEDENVGMLPELNTGHNDPGGDKVRRASEQSVRTDFSSRFSTQDSQVVGEAAAGVLLLPPPPSRLGVAELVGHALAAPVLAALSLVLLSLSLLLSLLTLPVFGLGVGVFALTVQLACFLARADLSLANAAARHSGPVLLLSAQEAAAGTLLHKFTCTAAYDVDGDSLRNLLYMWLKLPVAAASTALGLVPLLLALPFAAVGPARETLLELAQDALLLNARATRWMVGRDTAVYGQSDPYSGLDSLEAGRGGIQGDGRGADYAQLPSS